MDNNEYDNVDITETEQGVIDEFLSIHPDADYDLVADAVHEGIQVYMCKSPEVPLKSFLWMRIRTKLYRRKGVKTMTEDMKQSIIQDYESGLSAKDISEKYGINRNTLSSNLHNWKKSGLIGNPEKDKKVMVNLDNDCGVETNPSDMFGMTNLSRQLVSSFEGFFRLLKDAELVSCYVTNTESYNYEGTYILKNGEEVTIKITKGKV